MDKLKEKLEEYYSMLMDRDNEILVLADEEDDPELLEVMARYLVEAAAQIRHALIYCNNTHEENKTLNKLNMDNIKEVVAFVDQLEDLAAFANELDESGDPNLQKRASVIDQLLLNFGNALTEHDAYKKAQENEINRLSSGEIDRERSYKFPSEEHNKDIKAAEAAKAIKESIKEYRPMEASLSTRYSPDYPGVSLMRVSDNVYQCPMTKKIYNYTEGFTTMKGNKVPGTDVQNQTQALNDRNLEQMHFSTRESRLVSNE